MTQLTPAFPSFSFPRNMQKVSRFPIYHTPQTTQQRSFLHTILPLKLIINKNSLVTIRSTQRSISPPTMPKTIPRTPKPPSPVNVSHFPTEGWILHTRPTMCTVPGRIGTIIGYEEYYIHEEHVLCTRAFSVAAVATTVDDGASPRGAPNSMTKQATTARCHTITTNPSADLFLASTMTPGLFTAPNAPSENSTSRTWTRSCTTGTPTPITWTASPCQIEVTVWTWFALSCA